ncbi:MAG: hypothetical protein H0V91_01670 [Flavisolibacter sp.]|jgi:hypothetical protein|nr:hypothetical protein [Flavisolibacter sp.]
MKVVDLNHILLLVMDDMELVIEGKGAKIHIDNLPTIKRHRRKPVMEGQYSYFQHYDEPTTFCIEMDATEKRILA